MTCLFSNDH